MNLIPSFLEGGGVTGKLIRSIDWGQSPVGPVSSWPESLKAMVGMMLHSRHPMFLWWGSELVQFYNDAYLPSFGRGKHPGAMGQRGVDCWQEIWPIIWPQIDDVMARSRASWNEDQLVPIFRNGRLEEVYWTYGYSPVFVEDGSVGGTMVVCTETTARVIAERRLRALRALGDLTAPLDEPAQVHAVASRAIATDTSDIPFALFYVRETRGGQATLRAFHGVDAAIAAEVEAALRDRIDGCVRGDAPCAGPLDLSAVVGTPLSGGPWPEPATHAFIVEVRAADRSAVDGALVFGLSPRLPFDAGYREHLEHLAEQITLSLSRIEAFRVRSAVESERRNLLLQAPVATALLTGPMHRYELANSVYRKMVGRDVVGKTYREAFPELVNSPLLAIIDHVYTSGEPFVTNELRVALDQDGDGVLEDYFYRFNLEPIRDTGGTVYGMMVVAVDITDSVRARHVLERSSGEREALFAELEAANRTKDEVLALLGHELRNPLAPIVTALQLLKREGAEPSKEIQIIDRQVTHLTRLVDDLLDVAKITSGKVVLKKELVELADVLGRAVEMSRSLFEQRGHQLDIDVPRKGLRWHGDPVRLAQVIANLLTNAARYTEVGGRVELRAMRDDDELVIRVRDNGIGIPPEMLPNIFVPFVQAKQSANRSEGGLGLGLTLVKTLVALHGGSVSAASEGPGQGTEIEIRLPDTVSASGTTVLEPPVVPAGRPAGSRRILIVDDNLDAADLLGDVLRRRGHEVTVAHDPVAALAAVPLARPEIAVLDIGLPVMDGYELGGHILGLAPDCRLIALTGYGQDHDVARSRDAGFFAHLVKPVKMDELLRAIAK